MDGQVIPSTYQDPTESSDAYEEIVSTASCFVMPYMNDTLALGNKSLYTLERMASSMRALAVCQVVPSFTDIAFSEPLVERPLSVIRPAAVTSATGYI